MNLPRFVPKVWGHERIDVAQELYTLKQLTVLPGWRCSFHYHALKTETFLVQSGVLELEDQLVTTEGALLGMPQTRVLGPGARVILEPFTAHRFRAVTAEPCVFLEVSTQDLESDSYRLEPSGPC